MSAVSAGGERAPAPAVAVVVGPARPRFLRQPHALRGRSEEIEQAVVVVVDELRDRHAGRHVRRGALWLKRPWPSLITKMPAASERPKENP